MSETKDTGESTTQLRTGRTLRLRPRVEAGQVRQNFSHGRSKPVVVEKRRKRTIGRDATETAATPTPSQPQQPIPVAQPRRAEQPSDQRAPDQGARPGVVLRTLTEEEKDARAQALAEARIREAEERRKAEEEARRREELEKKEQIESKAAESRRLEEEARRKAEEEARRKAEEEASKRLAPEPAADTDEAREEEEARRRKRARPGEARPQGGRKEFARRQPRLTLANALVEQQRERSLAAMRRKRERSRRQAHGVEEPRVKISREVVIPETITIQELANRMSERGVDVIRLLMQQGHMLKITDVIDADTAQLIAEEMGHTAKRVSEADVEEGLYGDEDPEETLEPRAPVVTIMGHVDHGKTSLLDALRETNVIAGEAGGITQHIGAYQIETPGGQRITFIDTPGHAAFTAMRARGARVTDIVVLVVAADDGVMPQTAEAISHARAAGAPIIVAINKIDKPGADPQRVRTELLQYEVVPESMGGDVLEVEVSALQRTNLDGLLDAILLQAELLELKANPNRSAEGTVIEAQIDRGRGPVATVLVQRGTLRVGDVIVAGAEWGRVRALVNDRGENVSEAGPSIPVEVLGLSGAPEAGDRFATVENESRARDIADYRQRKRRELKGTTGQRVSLEQMMSQLKEAGTKEFPILIKADVQGSAEAIVGALEKLGTDEVAVRIIHSAAGGVTESDVTLAEASGAVIAAFNVRANAQARQAAERADVEIRYYNVIYDLVDDVKAAMSGMLEPELRETFLGNAEILEIFNVSKVGKVAGCRVTEGTVERGAKVRLIRDNVVIHEGQLASLKRFKDEVREVKAGQECGMAFENYQDMRVGDIIECYRVTKESRTLD